MPDMLLMNEIGARSVILGDHSAGIAEVRREREIEGVALVDLVAGHHGVRSRLGEYEAERDGRLAHRETQALFGNSLVARN